MRNLILVSTFILFGLIKSDPIATTDPSTAIKDSTINVDFTVSTDPIANTDPTNLTGTPNSVDSTDASTVSPSNLIDFEVEVLHKKDSKGKKN